MYARPLIKATFAAAAARVGAKMSKKYNIEFINVWTKFKIPFPWSRRQAASCKLQASSAKLIEMVDASIKRQAASLKLQAASGKLHNLGTLIKFQATRSEVLDQDKTILRM